MLFEYRAACLNPALALRMRARGVAPRCAVMRCGRQMRWLEGVWWRKRRLVGEHGRRSAAVVPAGAVAQAPAKGGGWRRVFGAARIESTAVKPHRNLDFRRCRESPRPGAGLLFRKEAKARAVLGLAEPVHPLPHLPRQAACLGGIPVCIPHAAGAAYSSSTVRQIGTRLWPCASAQGAAPRGAVMRIGRQMRWFRRARWRKRRLMGEDGGALCGGGSGGRGGASAGEGR